ncbi:MAG: DUF4345 domain-containing protein [Planctomycetota bacterium]
MPTTKKLRFLLLLSGLLATAIGAGLLFAPIAFHAQNGIQLRADASLLSELRAPGGALLLAGATMLAGALVRRFAATAAAVGAAVFSSYGVARLVGVGLDGVPNQGIVVATVLELGLGALFAVALLRGKRQAATRVATNVELAR